MTWGEAAVAGVFEHKAAIAGASSTHCDSDWQLMARLSPGSQGVTVNQHPLEFKLVKSNTVQVTSRGVALSLVVVAVQCGL